MKIAITGHTKGIGLALKNIFEANGHEVIGFARSTGYDVSDPESRKEIIKQSLDCDMFINNAHANYAQCDLLFELWELWQGQKKKIVNMSTGYVMRWEGSKRDVRYRTSKVALEDASQMLWIKSPWPAIMVVRPCLIDTPFVEFIESNNKVQPDKFAKVFYDNVMVSDFRVQVLGISLNPLD